MVIMKLLHIMQKSSQFSIPMDMNECARSRGAILAGASIFAIVSSVVTDFSNLSVLCVFIELAGYVVLEDEVTTFGLDMDTTGEYLAYVWGSALSLSC
ncbi:hypothetical protein AKJ16_DCAP07281 [Drosera capensis]